MTSRLNAIVTGIKDKDVGEVSVVLSSTVSDSTVKFVEDSVKAIPFPPTVAESPEVTLL